MKRFAMVAAYCCLVLAPVGAFAGDTGTYKIAEYGVKLTPRSNGTVEIEYHQKWNVTGGHIPWITVGVSNGNYEILPGTSRGAVRDIRPDNSGGSYVRIDLDRDYRPGESFDVWFAIVQRQLFYADNDRYKMDFTPGWYDRAEIGKLRLEVMFFAKMETVTAEPRPFRQEGQSLVWERTNLPEGEKVSISVSFPKGAFPAGIPKGELKAAGGSDRTVLAFVLLGATAVGFIIIIVLFRNIFKFVVWGHGGYRGYGGGGGIYAGGGRGGGSGRGGIFSGGGGGFGGAASSCACACVSCACACACAGGGGAGCDRKLTRRCPLCGRCSRKAVCPIFAERRG